VPSFDWSIPDWLLPAIAMTLVALAGPLVVIFALPGLWLLAVGSVLVKLWHPDLFSWWVVGFAVACAIASDITDLLSGAIGARRTGGTRRSGFGALAGGIVGAILGTPVFPVLGTLVGGVAGAGIGAALAQRTKEGTTWKHSAKVGSGAAAGWAAAIAVKLALSIVVALTLIAAAWIP